MPKVLNKHKDIIPKDAVYIGRPSKWGNPFSHQSCTKGVKVENRQLSVESFRIWIADRPLLIKQAKQELKGKDLVCFCAPLPCHGDVLLRIANE